jgi:hypothetical protein
MYSELVLGEPNVIAAGRIEIEARWTITVDVPARKCREYIASGFIFRPIDQRPKTKMPNTIVMA